MKMIICKFSPESRAVRFRFCSSYQMAMLAMFIWLPTTFGETWTIPSGAEGRENVFNVAEPFSRSGNILSQQIYSSSLFPMISTPGQLFQLDGLAFRLSTQGTLSFGSEATFDRVEILLSTGNGPFSTSLEQNHGDNILSVYDQALTLSGNAPPGATPSSFDLEIIFTTPFLYNPSEGALVVEIRKYGGVETLAVLAGAEIPGAIYYSDRGFGVETANNFGMETSFSYQVVPEPSVGAIAILGTIMALAIRRKNK